MKQVDFINGCLLSIGEREYMVGALSNAAQRRAYKIFKDTFISFTHECGWSFLRKVQSPTSWVGNSATVNQYQSVESVFLGTRRLTPAYEVELAPIDGTVEGSVEYYTLLDNKTIQFYSKPRVSDRSLVRVFYTEDLQLPAYSATAIIPFSSDFINIMEQLMSAKLCLQMLDDQGGYSTFMREYMVKSAKAVQRDQRISNSRPNMFRGGR